ncbi:hypothetical protein AB0M57_19950 [Streptomyces sp. NPDC051597]|uniref:hypothetical protein n=1 Tax=Streptomyces sp. NPDC051597 TaxID=3155049 RepID=UPI003424487F
MKTNILAVAGLAAVTALLTAAPAHAGIADGTLNNADVLDHISALNSNINSDVQSLLNNNANTRADGLKNNATGQHE